MTMRNTLPLLVTGLGLWSTTAAAADVDICVEHKVDFEDAGTVEDDYFIDNSDVEAAGIRIQVIRNSDSVKLFDDYADDSGSSVGCVTVSGLLSHVSYRLRVLSQAEVNGNTVQVWNNNTDKQLHAWADPDWSPPPLGGTSTVHTTLKDQWRIMAVAEWAMRRTNAGMTGQLYTFYTQECPGENGGNCMRSSELGRIYICPTGPCSVNATKKYLVAHEMGHSVAFKANGGDGTNKDCTYVGTTCSAGGTGSNHRLNSEEYQSCAANEGIGHFWAAYAFNDESDLYECGFDWYGDSVNWNNDSVGDEDRTVCEGYPDPLFWPAIGNADYHGNTCGGASNKGVEYDWLRFWWDLTVDESVPVEDIFTIWGDSEPDLWDEYGTDVHDELSAAASSNGWGTEYDFWADLNGTDR